MWGNMELVTTSAKGNPIVCLQCVAVVNGVFFLGADGSFPVRDGLRLWLGITGFFRTPSEVRKANGAIMHMWDVKTNVRVATLHGRQAAVLRVSIGRHKVARGPVIEEDALPEFWGAFPSQTESFLVIKQSVSRLESLIFTLCTEKKYLEKPHFMLERVPSIKCFEEFLGTDGNRQVLYDLINEEWEENKKSRDGHLSSLMSTFNNIITVFNLGDRLRAENPANSLGETNYDYHIPPKIEDIMMGKLTDWDEILCARNAFSILYTQKILMINEVHMTEDEIVECLRVNGRSLLLRKWTEDELDGYGVAFMRMGIRKLCLALTGKEPPTFKTLQALEKFKISEGLDADLAGLDAKIRGEARKAYLFLWNKKYFIKADEKQMTDDEICAYLREHATSLKEHAWTAQELAGSGFESSARARSAINTLIVSLIK